MSHSFRLSLRTAGLIAALSLVASAVQAQSAQGTVHPVNAAVYGPPAPGTIPDDDTVKGLTSTTAPTSDGSAAASPDDSVAGSRAGTPVAPGSTGASYAASANASTTTAVKGSDNTTLPAMDPDHSSWSTTVDGAAVKRAVKLAPVTPSPAQ